jgi:LysM repeat protein
MERRRLAHLAAIAAVIAATACLTEATAWSKTAPAKTAPARSYVVRSGDGGWFQIAKSHGTTMQHLLAANHASAGTPVKTGQRIQLPADARDDRTKVAKAHAAPAAGHAATH